MNNMHDTLNIFAPKAMLKLYIITTIIWADGFLDSLKEKLYTEQDLLSTRSDAVAQREADLESKGYSHTVIF